MKQHVVLCLISLTIFIGGLGIANFVQADDKESADKSRSEEQAVPVQKDPLQLKVTLRKHYIDGKIEEETHTETIWSMQDFWAYYDGWQVVNQEQGQIVFKKQVKDISPFMKENGYFGLYNDILTIFEGRPDDQQVIQSFYQIDTSELESYQADQLQSGIKIDSKEIYQYVLEAYREMTPSKSVNG
ncbi:intercompartmental signaling factor BofC [Aquibacillus kalidii]|uniref:intercompartmental signaling factor BofC n=1 Tax=Aquibacillus kalidii TaxID=2762597 RepID=UPI0016462EDE|nr:intercompartmental signaling factor BofC [Aquibacillus kalidii]